MKTLAIAIVATLSMAGCSTMKNAASALTGGKPHQVTVVNNINVPAAPAPQPIIVQAQPVVALPPAPVETPAPVVVEAPRKSRYAQLKAAGAGAVAGAALGTAVGYAMGGRAGASKGAALGAGAGAVGGAVAHDTK